VDRNGRVRCATVSWIYRLLRLHGHFLFRLQANDRVDPYIAVYEPPAGSMTGKLTHIRWRGLLPPDFVQSVVCATMCDPAIFPFLSRINACTRSPILSSQPSWFVAITSHPFVGCPVSYIPASHMEPGATPRKKSTTEPMGGPWCLILASDDEKRQGAWMKASHT
jgi:ribonuclease P/MRP protein subunit RPP40